MKNTITGLAAAHMVTDIYMPVLPAILPLLIAQNGYSYLAAGLLVTAYNITSSFTQPVIGWLSDTRGLTISVSISLLISAVFVALMGIAQDYYLIMAFAVIAALGHACFHPTALSIVSRLCTSENRGRITSYFVVGGNLGYAIGPVLAGVLVWWLGLPGLLFLVYPGHRHGLCLKSPPAGRDRRAACSTRCPGQRYSGSTVKMAVRDPDDRLHPPGMGGLCRHHLPADVPRLAGL